MVRSAPAWSVALTFAVAGVLVGLVFGGGLIAFAVLTLALVAVLAGRGRGDSWAIFGSLCVVAAPALTLLVDR